MAKLQTEQPVRDAEIITLAFHVDYWNYLGWKDPFSSETFSQRQRNYVRAFGLDGSYTPQMVVDGKFEFTGSRYDTALADIGKSVANKKGEVSLSVKEELLNPSLSVKISGLNITEDSDVMLAIAEDNLTTNVKRGENGGKQLNHISVVRNLVSLGTIKTGEKTFETEKSVKINSDWKKEKLNFVVFVQNKTSKNIAAVGKTKL